MSKEIMGKRIGIFFLTILIIVVLSAAFYFTFFFAYKCDSKECFVTKHAECKRSTYMNEIDGISWLYHIKGKSKNNCKISVKILEVKEGSIDQEKLEEKEMDCLMEIGDISSPESDIGRCHGELKEELQGMIIKKLHQYVLDNLGEISEDLNSI